MRDPATGEEIPTPLREMLVERDIERVVVVGLALDVCVKATALDASKDFQTAVVANASAAVELEPGDGERALEELRSSGVTIA
jgi:nicotinamidase-related amidase